jgi:Ca-activated chloride channel homolog
MGCGRIVSPAGPIAVVIVTLASAAGAPQAPPTLFQSGVTVVPITVSVERSDGTYVSGIDASRFRLLEDGIQRDITLFDDGNVPIDLLLLLDVSGSMNARLPTMKTAAARLINALRPVDRASLLSFGVRTTVIEPFTDDGARLKRSLETISSEGSTSLYDALYVALHQFGAPGTLIRRRALVVFSDGDDTASLMTFDAALDAALLLPIPCECCRRLTRSTGLRVTHSSSAKWPVKPVDGRSSAKASMT